MQLTHSIKILGCLLVLGLLPGCTDTPLNSPYPADEAHQNVLYSSFTERPKHLDPAISYSSNEVVFTGQIYEPPLQYHYLKRPYTLEPLVAVAMPAVSYRDAAGRRLPDDAPDALIAESVYQISLRPGIQYQPHPSFARDSTGRPVYASATSVATQRSLSEFKDTATRELIAEDYVYQIKRLASPQIHSPIAGLMAEYIVGFADYAKQLRSLDGDDKGWLDLRQHALSGVEVIDRYSYRIRIKGKYPQFVYWLAMPFFAPVPWEAELFYALPGMKERNLTLDWYPVGTGPFMLAVNNPNRQMVMVRNPNFHGERYPMEGAPDDAAAGLLQDAGKSLPFIDKVVFSLEKESIPYWNKFLQGYYDASGISSDSFDQAVRLGGQGEVSLTEDLRAKGIRLETAVASSSYYFGFNMLDPVVGGSSERARKLRQAISLAMDYEEFISIFANGRGIIAQGPLPPGIFGYLEGPQGINPLTHQWQQGTVQRRPLAVARQLLAEAGYPGGREAMSGKPLVLNLDITASGPDDKARLDWYRKQFSKLGIQLVIRNTDYNRFQDKMAKGNAQLFNWGWNADYPDPENFLFLLYGPNGKAQKGGENAANYANAEFDRLFVQMKHMENGPARQAVIDRMVAIVRHDAPWVWGLHPKQFSLYHGWYKNLKPNLMANNTMKYLRVDPAQRAILRAEWNAPVWWPVVLVGVLLVLLMAPAWLAYRRRERRAGQ